MRQTVLFRAAAGPRIGFGHLVRSQRLARALKLPAVLAIDAGPRARDAAAVLGCRIVSGASPRLLRSLSPALLVVDDPNAQTAQRWIREARQLGIPSASVHDLGMAPCDSDCSIDGTVAPGPMDLAGLRYAIIDPRLQRIRRRREPGGPPTVLIAFGGGHRQQFAVAVGRAVLARRPDVRVRIACGFGTSHAAPADEGITFLSQQASLAGEYRRATVAVLGGGVSLYEACVVGVPAIGVSIVDAQRPTIAGLARRGAVIDGGAAAAGSAARASAERIARHVCQLLESPSRRRELRRSAMRLVDGRGVDRVAAALRRLMRDRRP